MSIYGTATLTGTINGINPLFTFGTGTPEVYVNGVLQNPTTNYAVSTTSSTATLSFATDSIPQSADTLVVWLFNQ